MGGPLARLVTSVELVMASGGIGNCRGPWRAVCRWLVLSCLRGDSFFFLFLVFPPLSGGSKPEFEMWKICSHAAGDWLLNNAHKLLSPWN